MSECRICHWETSLQDDLNTEICNPCAQAEVIRLENEIVSVQIELEAYLNTFTSPDQCPRPVRDALEHLKRAV